MPRDENELKIVQSILYLRCLPVLNFYYYITKLNDVHREHILNNLFNIKNEIQICSLHLISTDTHLSYHKPSEFSKIR